MANLQPTNLDKLAYDIQVEFFAGRHQEMERRAIERKTMAVAIAVIAAVAGVIFTGLAISFLPATVGFSSILLIPAALLFSAANDLYRVSRMCDIVAERAQAQDNPLKALGQNGRDIMSYLLTQKAPWVKEVQKEVDNTLLLRPLAYQKAPHAVRYW